MKKVIVTQKGFNALEAQRREAMDKLKSVQGQKGDAAEVGGNAWHDNFSFEELCRQENMLNKQIADVSQILRNIAVVSGEPKSDNLLQVGHVAHIYIEEDDITRVVQVGGFRETDLDATPPVIDYGAPLLSPFLGKEEGYEARIKLGGASKTATLEKIEMKE